MGKTQQGEETPRQSPGIEGLLGLSKGRERGGTGVGVGAGWEEPRLRSFRQRGPEHLGPTGLCKIFGFFICRGKPLKNCEQRSNLCIFEKAKDSSYYQML